MTRASFKEAVYRAARAGGGLRLVRDSRWRGIRFPILCYHGIALEDEHRWRPGIYLGRATFEKRLELLRKERYEVLSLETALAAQAAGDLPARAVVLTFDDGHYDFLPLATPRLAAYGFPVTVYLTTWHVDHQIPIFELAASYLLWKAAHRSVHLGEWIPGGRTLALASAAAQDAVLAELLEFTTSADLGGEEKSRMLAGLARQLHIDFDAFCERRMLHLLSPAEVTGLAAGGQDFQLHTHAHRSPREETAYREQVRRNGDRIEALTGRRPRHFCYPSGETAPDFLPWLEAEGVRTAVTCEPGMVARDSQRLLLPRFLDAEGITSVEFSAWLSGFATLARNAIRPGPRRKPGFRP